MEVVTPDGELVCASRDEHAELFHALRRRRRRQPRRRHRDGGASCSRSTTVYGGDLTYPPADAADVLERWSRVGRRRPRRAHVERRADERPGRPGSTIVRGCWSGTVDAGRALLDALAARRCRRSSTAGASSASATSPRSAPIPTEPAPRLVTGGWLATPTGRRRSRRRSARRSRRPCSAATVRPLLRYCEVRHAGGAVADRAAAVGSSMGNRDGAFLLHLVGVADGRHDAAAHRPAPGRDDGRRSAPSCRRARYLNVLDGAARAGAAATSIDADDLRRHRRPSPAVDPDRRAAVRRPTTSLTKVRGCADPAHAILEVVGPRRSSASGGSTARSPSASAPCTTATSPATGRSARRACSGRSATTAATCGVLRPRLELDAGYLSRLLRSLEADGLVTVAASERDGRVRTARLTARGRAERRLLDRRSDDLAASLLPRCRTAQRDELVAAMDRVDRLLTAAARARRRRRPGRSGRPGLPGRVLRRARRALRRRLRPGPQPDGRRRRDARAARPVRRRPPARRADRLRRRQAPRRSRRRTSSGCGCRRAARGLSLGRRLLAELEALAAANGATAVQLETNRTLVEAIAMYRSAGYARGRPVQRRAYADHWFEKSARLSFTPRKQSVSARSVPSGRRRRAGPSTETPNGRWAGSAGRRHLTRPARRGRAGRPATSYDAGWPATSPALGHGARPGPTPSRRRRGPPRPSSGRGPARPPGTGSASEQVRRAEQRRRDVGRPRRCASRSVSARTTAAASR